MEGDNFCTACGAELQPGSNYCPQCGRPLDGSAPPGGANFTMSAMPVNPPGSFLILIWGVLAIVGGISSVAMLFMMDEELFGEYVDMLADYGLTTTITFEDLRYFAMAYVFIVVSGVLALASYFYCRRKTQWRPAVYLCALSSVVCLGTVVFDTMDGAFCFVIGVLVTYVLYRGRSVFADGRADRQPPSVARRQSGPGK